MAGYDWNAGKSNNAVQAVENGLLTKTQLSAWQRRAVEAGAVVAKEWHHTSKFFNKTNYYDPADFADLNPADFPPTKKTAAAKPRLAFEDFVIERVEFTGNRLYDFTGAAYFETANKKGGWFKDETLRYGGANTKHRAVFTADNSASRAACLLRNRIFESAYKKTTEYLCQKALNWVAAERKRIASENGFFVKSLSEKWYKNVYEKDDFMGSRERLVFTDVFDFLIETT